MDAGTADSLLDAAQSVARVQRSTGRYIGCLEELGLDEGWLTPEQVHQTGTDLAMTKYGKYLLQL